MADRTKVLAKAFHMVVGVDLIGSVTSMKASSKNELEVTPLGIVAHSKKSNRTILIPWTNIKGAELFTAVPELVVKSEVSAFEEEANETLPKKRGRPFKT